LKSPKITAIAMKRSDKNAKAFSNYGANPAGDEG
jgi:hypothetical protein